MPKSLSITLISIFIILSLFSFAYSQQEETLAITTYYPAPSGSYHEMRVDQMSVGSGYRSLTVPANSLIVNGSVGIGTNNPQAKLDVQGGGIKIADPAGWTGSLSGNFLISDTGPPPFNLLIVRAYGPPCSESNRGEIRLKQKGWDQKTDVICYCGYSTATDYKWRCLGLDWNS